MLAPAFPWEFGMRKAPLGWKSNAELLPTEETLPMPWALLVLTVNPMSPAARGLSPAWAKRRGRDSPASLSFAVVVAKVSCGVSHHDSDHTDIMQLDRVIGRFMQRNVFCILRLMMVSAHRALLNPGGCAGTAPCTSPVPCTPAGSKCSPRPTGD